jgi:F0F1-type ATP synthase membrane subunit b/b'
LEALGINLGLLVSQIFNFALLAVLLYLVAYKPILRMLDERSARIKKGLEEAKDEIARERELAMAELRQQVAALSLAISEKVIGEALDDRSQRRLIADFLEQTEELK